MESNEFEDLTKDLFTEDEKSEMPDLSANDDSDARSFVETMVTKMMGMMDGAARKCAEIEADAIVSADKMIKTDGFDKFQFAVCNMMLAKAMSEDEFYDHPLTRVAMTKGFLRAAYEAGRREAADAL